MLFTFFFFFFFSDCRELDPFEGGDDTNSSLCHAGDIAVEIPGGALSYTGLTPGSTATVSCEDGYELSGGDGSLVCQDDGTWSGPTPTCVEGECSDTTVHLCEHFVFHSSTRR